MSTLLTVYNLLEEAEVVHTAEEFSQKWCQRSQSWYANRKHSNTDFSIGTAINCNLMANLYLDVLPYRSKRYGRPSDNAINAVREARRMTQGFLEQKHRVLELVKTPLPTLT